MTKIADSNGNVIPGITRTTGHGIIVEDVSGLTKYRREKERIERIGKLESEVSEIKSMLGDILKAINGTHNV